MLNAESSPSQSQTQHSDASYQPITTVLSFKQPFSGIISENLKPAFLRANIKKSFEDQLWYSLYTHLQIPRDDDTAASHTCSSIKPQTMQTSSGNTKQQAPASAPLSNSTSRPATPSPNSKYPHHPNPRATNLLGLAPALRGHIKPPTG